MKYVIMAATGLVVGIIARFIYPGAVPLHLIPTALLGIGGSFLAGTVGNLVHKSDGEQSIHPASFVYSILGALVLIFIARHFLHLV